MRIGKPYYWNKCQNDFFQLLKHCQPIRIHPQHVEKNVIRNILIDIVILLGVNGIFYFLNDHRICILKPLFLSTLI